jgi:integrase
MKGKRAHTVALPAQAREILACLPRWKDCEYVFTAVGKAPVNIGGKSGKRLIAREAAIPEWHLHDLRRTVAVGLQRLKVDPQVVSAVLSHASPVLANGTVPQVTSIYAVERFEAEKAAALQLWADHVERLVGGQDPSAGS